MQLHYCYYYTRSVSFTIIFVTSIVATVMPFHILPIHKNIIHIFDCPKLKGIRAILFWYLGGPGGFLVGVLF